jgi:hypothetical protein
MLSSSVCIVAFVALALRPDVEVRDVEIAFRLATRSTLATEHLRLSACADAACYTASCCLVLQCMLHAHSEQGGRHASRGRKRPATCTDGAESHRRQCSGCRCRFSLGGENVMEARVTFWHLGRTTEATCKAAEARIGKVTDGQVELTNTYLWLGGGSTAQPYPSLLLAVVACRARCDPITRWVVRPLSAHGQQCSRSMQYLRSTSYLQFYIQLIVFKADTK